MGTILAAALCLLFSCDGKGADAKLSPKFADGMNFEATGGSHCWFCFSEGKILPVDLPENAPPQNFEPWTESVRVSAAAQNEDAAYFLANRAGLVRLSDSPSKPCQIFSDALYFSDLTADSLAIIDKTPVFKLYRDSFFGGEKGGEKTPFLVQFRPDSKTFYPLLSNADIGLNENCEAADLFFDGKNWTGAFKNSASNRVLFDYVQFSTQKSLVNLTDAKKTGQIQKKEISPQLYQEKIRPRPFEELQESLKSLLSEAAKSAPIFVKSAKCDGVSPQFWTNDFSADRFLFAFALEGKNFALAVFEDGTAYFSGKLSNRGANAKIAFKLPALPENFKYGDAALCGKILYVAWEERDFYKTGRSGFLTVNLENVLQRCEN